jgi:predicted negative regulator of RcsB-dependent stress response
MSKSKQGDVVHLARVRLAQIMLDENNPAAVIQLLSPIDSDSFSALYDELLGDAYVILGETEKARQSYRKALLRPGKMNGLVQLKLNDLGAGGLAG